MPAGAALHLKNVDPNVGGGVDRDKLPASDFAGKNRSFPIKTPQDVADAASSIGRAGKDNFSTDQLKKNIIRIAKRKGASFVAKLPKVWRSDTKSAGAPRFAPFVSLVTLDVKSGDAPRMSWVQVLRTGSLYDPRYGDFTVTAQDLAAMVANFTSGTFPVAPTRLPIDYNHGTSQPKSAEMGKAAGWVAALELRGQGDELWAHVEWTDDAANMIAAKEYQGLSASFAFAYKNSNGGEEIGPTLFGAALTNVPVVHGMQAATLALADGVEESSADEDAEAIFSFDEQRRRVQEALSEAFGVVYGYGSMNASGCYLIDLFDGRAIYREYAGAGSGDLFQVPFEIDADGVVAFTGSPVEVVADYRPLGVTDMAKTITVKSADGKDIQLTEDVVRELAKAHAPAAAEVVELAAFKALEGKVEASNTKIAEQDAKILDLSTKNLALEKERTEKTATDKVDALIRAGKATPAEKPALLELAIANLAIFDKVAATRPVIAAISGAPIGSASDGAATSASSEAMALARTEQEQDTKLSSNDAIARVFHKNPALYERYKAETAVKV
jgi:hypothetical protein